MKQTLNDGMYKKLGLVFVTLLLIAVGIGIGWLLFGEMQSAKEPGVDVSDKQDMQTGVDVYGGPGVATYYASTTNRASLLSIELGEHNTLSLFGGQGYGSIGEYDWNDKKLIYRPFVEMPYSFDPFGEPNRPTSSAPFYEIASGVRQAGLNFYLKDGEGDFSLVYASPWITRSLPGGGPSWPRFTEGKQPHFVKVGFLGHVFFDLLTKRVASVGSRVFARNAFDVYPNANKIFEAYVHLNGVDYVLDMETEGVCSGYGNPPGDDFVYQKILFTPIYPTPELQEVVYEFEEPIVTQCRNDESNGVLPWVQLVSSHFSPSFDFQSILFMVRIGDRAKTEMYFEANTQEIIQITEEEYLSRSAFTPEEF